MTDHLICDICLDVRLIDKEVLLNGSLGMEA